MGCFARLLAVLLLCRADTMHGLEHIILPSKAALRNAWLRLITRVLLEDCLQPVRRPDLHIAQRRTCTRLRLAAKAGTWPQIVLLVGTARLITSTACDIVISCQVTL